MKSGNLIRLLAVFGLGSVSVCAAVERTVERHFAAPEPTLLQVEICQGPVRFEASSDDQIHIFVHETVEAADNAEADERLKNVDLFFSEKNHTVEMAVRFRHTVRWSWESWPPVNLACTFQLPRRCSLELIARDGDVVLGNLEGGLTARIDGGAFFAGEIRGPVSIESLRGDVSVAACFEAAAIKVAAGNVIVGRAEGPTMITATGGVVEVQHARARLEVTADGADIRVGLVPPCTGGVVLKASGGDIEAALDLRLPATVSAKASRFGKVRVKNLPLAVTSGAVNTASLSGTTQGGGTEIRIVANGGSVRLSGREP